VARKRKRLVGAIGHHADNHREAAVGRGEYCFGEALSLGGVHRDELPGAAGHAQPMRSLIEEPARVAGYPGRINGSVAERGQHGREDPGREAHRNHLRSSVVNY
jgi:hypothetical protein